MVAVKMSHKSCAFPDKRAAKCNGDKKYINREASRRKQSGDAIIVNKSKYNIASGVRVGCPYYMKDPQSCAKAACRGNGYKEIAKLKDHLKDCHNLTKSLMSQLSFKSRRFTSLKSLEEKWKLAFSIIFPEVPKEKIPSGIATRIGPVAALSKCQKCRQEKESIAEKDKSMVGGEGYVNIKAMRKMLHDRAWDMFKDGMEIHIADFMVAFGPLFDGAVQDVITGRDSEIDVDVQMDTIGEIDIATGIVTDFDLLDLDMDVTEQAHDVLKPHSKMELECDAKPPASRSPQGKLDTCSSITLATPDAMPICAQNLDADFIDYDMEQESEGLSDQANSTTHVAPPFAPLSEAKYTSTPIETDAKSMASVDLHLSDSTHGEEVCGTKPVWNSECAKDAMLSYESRNHDDMSPEAWLQAREEQIGSRKVGVFAFEAPRR
ncbi:unnamed protein product [Periconia digitata]|uniref:Uncharacterized protein n=1 Tax=Periconia digitata TaxID=1303443 RepID=A0A9W4XKB8_9PLEO|nr:unnamed protein product [Periconia digitata]